jgi:uncharacterized protein
LKLEVRNMVVHQTADPEVAVAEWDYDGVVTATGRTFRVSNVQVSRVRDGRIVASRDYHNHAFMVAVMGRLPSLVAALGDTTIVRTRRAQRFALFARPTRLTTSPTHVAPW